MISTPMFLRATIPLLAAPLSWYIVCRYLGACDWSEWLLYQWPSYVACYLPYWSFLYYQRMPGLRKAETAAEKIRVGMYGVNAVYAGATLRMIVTAIVLLYWKDEKLYKPIYIFLSHLGSFFVFQLATVVTIKK